MIVRDPGKRHIGFFDVHVPKHSPLKEPLGYVHDHGCDHFIVGGDFLNLEWASHWNERVFKQIGVLKLREFLEKEIEEGKKVLREIRKAIPKRARMWYIPGNHEAWLFYACFYHNIISLPWKSEDFHFKSDVADMLAHGLSGLLSRLLDAKRVGFTVVPYNEPLKIGKIVYLHGHQFGGQRPTQTSARRYPGVNLVFGHHHKHEVTPIYNQGDPSQCYEHVAVPCMTGLSPGYLRDKSTTWLNGFWIADHRGGLFDGRVKKMFGGKLIP